MTKRSKQEEIREELVSRIYRMTEDDLPLGETVDGILEYLNDNGVVLKVDLPRHPSDRDYADDYDYEPLIGE